MTGRTVLLAFLVFAAACSSGEKSVAPDTSNTGPLVPAAIRLVSGDSQRAMVNTDLPQPLAFQVTTVDGRPVPNVKVSLDNPSLSSGATTDDQGRIAFYWRMGFAAGVQRLTATAGSLTATATATALPGPPASVTVVSGDLQGDTVTKPLPAPLVARVADRYGNPVPGVPVRWPADSTVGSPSDTLTVTDSTGQVSTHWTLGIKSGWVHPTAVENSAYHATFTAWAMSDAPVGMAIVSGDGQSGPYGSVLQYPLVGRVYDRYGNGVQYAVVYSSSDSGAPLEPVYTADSAGIARVHFRLPSTYGTATMTMSSGSLPPLHFGASSAPAHFQTVTAGAEAACALTIEGIAYCWGNNVDNTLGTIDVAPSLLQPAAVRTAERFTKLSMATWMACGVAMDATLWCWGDPQNDYAATGYPGGLPFQPIPNRLFIDVAVGPDHVCAVDSSGAVLCWGMSASGATGLPNGTNTTLPSPLPTTLRFIAVGTGDSHTCAITTDHAVYCWGSNAEGQLGVDSVSRTCGSTPCSVTPVKVSITAHAIALGAAHTCSISDAGPAVCWGRKVWGALGGGAGAGPLPVTASTDQAPTVISASADESCAADVFSNLWCWGLHLTDFGGEAIANCTANGATYPCQPLPERLLETLSFTTVSVGAQSLCALGTNGLLYCWGLNNFGQNGDGTYSPSTSPVLVKGQQ